MPGDIATEDFKWLCLEPDEEQAYQLAQSVILGDPRFEYLEQREAADALWRFVCQCHADRSHDHVAPFIAERAREVLELTCYLPVEHLKVETETSIAGLRLLAGWALRRGTAYPLNLEASSIELAHSQLVEARPLAPRNKLERKANLAARWMERAMLATEPLDSLLYLFFALESLLGDTGEGQKAGLVALRRAVLSQATGQGFTHPSRTYWLYEKVRSAAVHGSEPPDVSEADVRLFAGDVRVALDEYLRYGQEQGFTRQSQLVAALDSHPDRPGLIEWIRENGGDMWNQYLDKIAPDPVAENGD